MLSLHLRDERAQLAIESAVLLDQRELSGERGVVFRFKPGSNRELPLILGQLPVLPKHWWATRTFDAASLEAGSYDTTLRVDGGAAGTLDIGVMLEVRASQVVASAGELLVTDQRNARVLRVDPDTGSVSPFSPRPGSGVHASSITF